MSVFTPVSGQQLEQFLGRFALGELVDYRGINDGIENTNYFVTTEQASYVLTLFEKLDADELPFFLGLMAHLSEHEIPCAHPIADRYGDYLQHLNGRPAALVQCLMGASKLEPSAVHCREIGNALARLHLAAGNYRGRRENDRGYQWWCETSNALQSHLDPDDLQQLNDEIRFQEQHVFTGLPRGIIHADLFRDNAMFVGDELTGIIDFYYACNGTLLYDLAVTVNDWCRQSDGSIDDTRQRCLMAAYNAKRPLVKVEDEAWPVMLRAAALRFWLSRLYDKHFPRPGEITHIKDPDIFRNTLAYHIAQAPALRVQLA